MFIFLLRRLSVRSRRRVGLALLVVGLALFAASAAVAAGMLIHAVVVVVVGAVLFASAEVSRRRAS